MDLLVFFNVNSNFSMSLNRNLIFTSNVALHHIILICSLLGRVKVWHFPRAVPLVIRWFWHLLFSTLSLKRTGSWIGLAQILIPTGVLLEWRGGRGESRLDTPIFPCFATCLWLLGSEGKRSARIIPLRSNTSHGRVDPHPVRLLSFLY